MEENRNELEYNENTADASESTQTPTEQEAREIPDTVETKSEPIFRPNKKRKARIKLHTGPATTVANLAPTDAS